MNIKQQKKLSAKIDKLAAALPKVKINVNNISVPVFRKRYTRSTDHPGFQSF